MPWQLLCQLAIVFLGGEREGTKTEKVADKDRLVGRYEGEKEVRKGKQL